MLDSELKLVRDYHRQRPESEGVPVDLAASTRRRAVNVSVLKVGKNWRALVRVSKAQSFKTKTEAIVWGEHLFGRVLKEIT